MTAMEQFTEWAESIGCTIEIEQADDSSGYTVCWLTTPGGTFSLTVHEPIHQEA